jgi:ribosomal protein L11 methyltransferase
VKTRKRFVKKWWTGDVKMRDVGELLRLVPYWEIKKAKPDRINLIIDPGPSFGAGEHASTVLALELLEQVVPDLKQTISNPSLLDAGTGTGVLAIAGKKLGTGFTAAFDIDSASVFNAKRNLRINGLEGDRAECSRIELFAGGIDCIEAGFDVVTANLAAPVLVRLADDLVKACCGHLVLSGIADAMTEKVLTTYQSTGMQLLDRSTSAGWNALSMYK